MELLEGVAELGSLRGRSPAKLMVKVEKELTEEDLIFRKFSPVGTEVPSIAKLRYAHHKLAQVLASGTKEADAAVLTGYSVARIKTLKQDPAFKELCSHYSESTKEVYHDLHTRMAGIAMNASEELQERLEEKPESLTNKELLEVLKVTNDRGGNSPVSRSLSANITLGANEIAAIRQEVKQKEHGRIIEATSNYQRPEVGEDDNKSAPETSSGETAQGLKGEGEDV